MDHTTVQPIIVFDNEGDTVVRLFSVRFSLSKGAVQKYFISHWRHDCSPFDGNTVSMLPATNEIDAIRQALAIFDGEPYTIGYE